MEGRSRRSAFSLIKYYLLAMALIVVLGLAFYAYLRSTLLYEYEEYGTATAARYASEIEGDLNLFEAFVGYGAECIDARTLLGYGPEEILDWIPMFYERLQQVFGEGVVDPYVVYDGVLLAANSWEGDATYDYAFTGWYRGALAADGEVYFSDVYDDAITGRNVLTISRYCPASDGVIAFDIFPENLQVNSTPGNLPDGCGAYILDSSGNLVFSRNYLEVSDEEIDEYAQVLRSGFSDGSLVDADDYVVDPAGRRRGVYAWTFGNGWTVYVTVPFDTIFRRLNTFTLAFNALSVPTLAALALMARSALKSGRRAERDEGTIRALSNRYYAIYRVNYREDTYEMVKGSDYVKAHLPPKGPYPDLLRVAGEVIEEGAYRDFLDSFSAESIRNLVARGMTDFGGDFLRLFGGEYRWVNVRIKFDASLDSDEVLLSFQEVDDEKRRQLQERKLLQEALDNARRSEKTKHAFFSNMSHDMRTPLNAVISLSDLARANAGDREKVENYTEKIQYSAKQLLNLVNDILEVSRMDSGKLVLVNQALDLQRTFEDCTGPFRLQAQQEGKDFDLSISVRDRMVNGDAARITQILNNLLSNAFKFTSPGDKVSVELKQVGVPGRSQYQIVVADTGAGMGEDFLPRLFEPYSREQRFSTLKTPGTGLGMPIVKNLVTGMSGQINVQSKLGEGTTFTITIPFETIQAEAPEREAPAVPEDVDLSGRRILLAEDNIINMELATEILKGAGIVVEQAWNGEEALSKFSSSEPWRYDAILMDMKMPRMDGCEAAKAIRALERPDAKEVPIIAVTANAFSEDIAATTEAGMDAHIAKPIDFKALCATLASLLGRGKGGNEK